MDCRPQKFPPKDEKGRVEVLKVNYVCRIGGKVVEGDYTKSNELSEEINDVVEAFDEIGVKAERSTVRAAIRQAFDEERDRIQGIANDLFAKHDPNKLDKIKLAKIIPQNIVDVVPHASIQELELMLCGNPCDDVTERGFRGHLEAALKGFDYEPPSEATCFGPAAYIFDGTEEEEEEPAAALEALD